MDYTVKNESELMAALSDVDCSAVKVDGRIRLTKPLILDGKRNISFIGVNGAAFEYLARVDGFSETELDGRVVWTAEIPDDIAAKCSYNAFTADRAALKRPRLPKTGFYRIKDYPDRTPGVSAMQDGDLGSLLYNRGEIPQLKYPETAQVRIFHWWTDELLYIDAIDYVENVIKFKTPSLYVPREEDSPNQGARWYLDNVFEALDTAGEYYITPDCKRIYYVPFDGETVDAFSLLVSTTEKTLIIDGCENISFENIEFFGSDRDRMNVIRCHSQAASDVPCAIDIDRSSNVTFNCCRFTELGLSGIGIDNGSHHITVDGCELFSIGGNPIYIKGENLSHDDWITTYPNKPHNAVNRVSERILHDITVKDCHIHGYGKVYFNACGIILKYAYNCELMRNEIHDGVYTGISVGWVWGYAPHATNHITVENNHIYDIGKELLSDMGGIYTLGQQEGTVIRGNRIHDIEMYMYGGWGVYLDEGSSDILVERNICYDLHAQPFHQHYGSNNLLRENVFAFGGGGAFVITRKEEHLSVILERNILVSDGTAIYGKPADCLNITDCANLMWDYSGELYSGVMPFDAHKRIHSFPAENRRTVDQMREGGLYKCAVIADPKFTDVGARDFSLKPDSPAIALGFDWLVKK